MINLDEIIGDIIFISFVKIERYLDIGIRTSSGHFLLKGYDQMGLWLEHPGIVFIHNEDKSGNPLPGNASPFGTGNSASACEGGSDGATMTR